MSDSERQTGRTTEQMREAPRHAVYVWCNRHTDYPVELMRRLGRTDLVIVTPEKFCFFSNHNTFIVVDHATVLSEAQLEIVARVNSKLQR